MNVICSKTGEIEELINIKNHFRKKLCVTFLKTMLQNIAEILNPKSNQAKPIVILILSSPKFIPVELWLVKLFCEAVSKNIKIGIAKAVPKMP